MLLNIHARALLCLETFWCSFVGFLLFLLLPPPPPPPCLLFQFHFGKRGERTRGKLKKKKKKEVGERKKRLRP